MNYWNCVYVCLKDRGKYDVTRKNPKKLQLIFLQWRSRSKFLIKYKFYSIPDFSWAGKPIFLAPGLNKTIKSNNQNVKMRISNAKWSKPWNFSNIKDKYDFNLGDLKARIKVKLHLYNKGIILNIIENKTTTIKKNSWVLTNDISNYEFCSTK